MKGSRRRIGVVAAFGLVAACALLGLPPGRSVQAQEDPASRAIAYLQAQQGADGSIAGPSGGYADSELFAIAAAAAGYDPRALTAASGVSVMSYLAASAAGACPAPPADPATSGGAGDCGELIQAVEAAGEDPTAFGGEDLVSLLGGYYDPATGEYGDGEAFTQALAIQGLVAAGVPVPAAAVRFLVGAQDSDGGWDYRDDRDDPNGATDYDLSDTNSTAMVLMALDAAGEHGRDASALAWLAGQQDGDGGFPYQAGAGSDPDSTALVVQAIAGTGGDPVAAGWTVAGETPLGYLEATQDPDGGYTYPGNPGPDPFTTAEVPAALLLQPFPVRATFSPGYTPAREDGSILATLLYLQAQQGADGSIAGPSGGYADSELFAIAAAAAGYDPRALTAASGVSVMSYLAASAAGACPAPPADPATSGGAGDCGELIQAVEAAGEDPTAFGGEDLVSLLGGYYDPATGEYGDGEAFTQALAIQGLVAAGVPVPAAAVRFLVGAQDSDGGWDYRDDRDDPNGATDYDLSDTNSTAMVLMALDAAGEHGRDASALAWLAGQQDGDGGFPYQAGAGSDPDSTALVVQAIAGTGGDPVAAGWTVAGETPLGYLEATQDPDGGYTYPGNPGPDPFTTAEVPAALERLAFPIPFGSRQWYPPGATLGTAPSPSATPTPGASPSSSPPAGVITAPPAVSSSPAASPSAAAQAASTTASPSGVSLTTPPATAPASVTAGAPSGRGTGGASPPVLLIYAVVVLGLALVAGGARWALAARR
jgi:hypothetical protein